MKRLLMLASIALPLAVGAPSRSNALTVECLNCSTIYTQLLEYGQQAKQLASQLQQEQIQLRQYQNMITNTVSIPQSMWASVQADIMRVQSLAQQASVLTGGTGSFVSRLQQAGSYGDQLAYLPQNFTNQLDQWQSSIGSGLQSFGMQMGVQQGQSQNYAVLQQQLEAHSTNAVGQMQAIQAGNELAALTNTRLASMQEVIVASAQVQARDIAKRNDREALIDAERLRMLSQQPPPLTGYQTWSVGQVGN